MDGKRDILLSWAAMRAISEILHAIYEIFEMIAELSLVTACLVGLQICYYQRNNIISYIVLSSYLIKNVLQEAFAYKG